MSAYRFPVLVWEDQAGYFTAKLIEYKHSSYIIWAGKFFGGDNHTPTGTASTAAEAIYQVKEYLIWSYEHYPEQDAPDFLDAELLHFRVDIRPEYRLDGRIFPAEQLLPLRVACVYGRQETGLLVCTLPMLGITFYYYDAQMLKSLVHQYVQERLKGMTPQELATFLPPENITLTELVIQTSYKPAKYRRIENLANLSTVAEPIGDRSIRRRYPRVWQREIEVADLLQRLQQERANVILVSESGMGKTAILVETVHQIERQLKQAAKNVAEDYEPRRFWLTNGGRLMAGMPYLGQWEERCEAVIRELSDIGGWLCVENLLDLMRGGGESATDSIAAFLVPYLEQGELHIVAEATPTELAACRRLLPGFVDLCQILKIEPFSSESAITLLDRAITSLKQQAHLETVTELPTTIYRLFQRFMPYQAFPGPALTFIKQLIEEAERAHLPEITLDNMLTLFIKQTGLPELFLRDELLLDQTELIQTFSKQVVGQPAASTIAAQVVTTFKAGLNDPHRPIAVLLFCGPTGVGKTEMAKALAHYFFGASGAKDRLIRLDMSEYSGFGAARRLLSDPQGEPSDFIKRVRQQPFMVLLFDEIEKADPEVFDLLLGLFDEGRLTDKYGRTTYFQSALIIMTSNLGADKFGGLGFNQQATPVYESEAKAYFRPEFYNRIDAIVRFAPLEPAIIAEITHKELREVAQREGFVSKNIHLAWTQRLIEYLAQTGFDARYGARPLQRTIETKVVTPLAAYLVAQPYLMDCLLTLDYDPTSDTSLKIELSDGGNNLNNN